MARMPISPSLFLITSTQSSMISRELQENLMENDLLDSHKERFFMENDQDQEEERQRRVNPYLINQIGMLMAGSDIKNDKNKDKYYIKRRLNDKLDKIFV